MDNNDNSKHLIAIVVLLSLVMVVGSWAMFDFSRQEVYSRSVTSSTVQVPTSNSLHSTATFTNCRFGVGEVYRPLDSYADEDIENLQLGWYLNWRTALHPIRPHGVEYAQLLTVNGASYTPSGATLAEHISANPGAFWLVGNEPDCVFQNNVLPQDYAQAYHDAYSFIKEHDPTAQVVVGNIVQPTPLRMAYLDLVLEKYGDLYGEALKTDAWGIHSFILREASCAVYPDSCWGCEIPPGIDADHGMLYDIEDTDNLSIFQQRIIDFREWLAAWGYRSTPLFITEYGSLVPHSFEGWGAARTKVFMYGTFDFLRTASDSEYGYPLDGNRLVQRWLWYSLDDKNYGGPLFDSDSLALLQSGSDFAAYTSAISPTVDLVAVQVTQDGPVPYSSVESVTVTLRALVSNAGNTSVTQTVTVRFLDGGGSQIGTDQIVDLPISGCAAARYIELCYPNLAPGAHEVRMIVDPENHIVEQDEQNNEVKGVILVARVQIFLPLVARKN